MRLNLTVANEITKQLAKQLAEHYYREGWEACKRHILQQATRELEQGSSPQRSTTGRMRHGQVGEDVFRELTLRREPATTNEIIQRTGHKESSVYQALVRLRELGKIAKDESGRYYYKEEADAPI
jgi:predicted Rossmann fold nucleotide-binding protein DprA/Smf involved in DNA uptake